jgi:DNA-binding transcriptional MerR regulator
MKLYEDADNELLSQIGESLHVALDEYGEIISILHEDDECARRNDAKVKAALRAQQERDNPKPLTLEELEKRNAKTVFVSMRNAISSGEWYIVDIDEAELKSPWDRISLDGWDEGDYYKAYDHEPKDRAGECHDRT